MQPMNITFCWSAISGYMAACWRELASRPGVHLHVIAHRPHGAGDFASSLLDGISHRFLDTTEAEDSRLVERLVLDSQPDVVAMTGWWIGAYRQLLVSERLAHAKFIMGIDSPWRTEIQYLSRIRYGRFIRHVDQFFVTGERSWQYMKRLGIPPERITRGMYGVDVASWTSMHRSRPQHPWPRRFLFLGRYEPVKALDVLVPAYNLYRSQVTDPWELMCCGRGPDGPLLQGVPGVVDRGFIQPADLADVFLQSGALVMPSRYDPWPLALVEACAAGLPIICSDACGSAVENVRPLYNGLVVPTESVAELARAMVTVHEAEEQLPEWGRRSHEFASAYSAQAWADRWLATCGRLVGDAASRPTKTSRA
jgi:glycosyltransferase involved in cell wall biosynthesis